MGIAGRKQKEFEEYVNVIETELDILVKTPPGKKRPPIDSIEESNPYLKKVKERRQRNKRKLV